ncbi:hypothetical protein CEP54_000126 [Fusarium duplospermum]|uniref:F-box domain-containing protein n=1 Tax=Fusarium duplospermum TaxID=1325734 RepID=A0A428R8R4_9HYPO|nr:hypothetical protein CEP54_000126 [Fusarium duplospermum]
MDEHQARPIKSPPNPNSFGSLEDIYRELWVTGEECHKSKREVKDEDSDLDNAMTEQAETACRDAVFQLDLHRQALRKRAMDLSRDTLRSLTVLDLPMEILVQIFGYFQHQDIEIRHNSNIYWPSKVQSVSKASEPLLIIYNTRQVCSLFNTLASPLLCPFLNLKLDQESLDRAEILLSNPYISSGVVGIQVSLEYRPIELAESFRQFAIWRMGDLGQLNHAVDWPIDAIDGEDLESKPDQLRTGNYKEIYKAWDYFVGPMEEPDYLSSDDEEDGPHCRIYEPKGTYQPDKEGLEFWRIFCNSHKEYVKLQKSQHDLIQSRTFVKTLSSLASRLDRPLALRIHSSFDPDGLPNRYDAYKVLTDKMELANFMPTAHTWHEMYDMRSPVVLHQAKILSELPIAMHKAGVVLRHLTVGCLPELYSFSKLCPGEDETLDSPAWDELSEACQHLEVFQVQWGGRPARGQFLFPEDQGYNERYVNSVLSSQQLEHVNVTISPFGLNDGIVNSSMYLPYMPAVLANINWPRIKTVSINTFSLNQEELETFCKGLSSNLEYVGLISINLQSGSWVKILDILRDKMASSRKSVTCRVWMADLRGGELGQRESRFVSPSPNPRSRELEDPEMADRFRDYIKGSWIEIQRSKSSEVQRRPGLVSC